MNPTKNVVCPGCTLLCDDVEIMYPESKAVATKNACDKGQKFFQTTFTAKPTHSVSGKPVALDAAIMAAAEILNRSKSPMICGLHQLTTEAQQSAWKLADRLGATIDTTFSNDGRASMFALQRVGRVSATIGEIANRSDLLLFWFCDPETTHPRMLERLNMPPDRPERRVIVVDETETKTAQLADEFIQTDPDSCPAILATLRAQFAETRMEEARMPDSTGLEPKTIEKLASVFAAAKYGSIFFGQTTPDSAYDLATESLSQLIRQLNLVTRFVGMKLRTDGNAQSAENVLAWSSGYAFAVNHHLKYPRYNWLEYSAETMINRGQCDAILFATTSSFRDTFGGMSQRAIDHLGSIAKIAITPVRDFPCEVAIQVGFPGLNESGEFCRNDDVLLPLMNTPTANQPSTAVILDRINQAC